MIGTFKGEKIEIKKLCFWEGTNLDKTMKNFSVIRKQENLNLNKTIKTFACLNSLSPLAGIIYIKLYQKELVFYLCKT